MVNIIKNLEDNMAAKDTQIIQLTNEVEKLLLLA